MTAKDREIQRYDFWHDEGCGDARMVSYEPEEDDGDGEWMRYSSHLRAVKLAQIEVLEEASKLICKRCDSGDPFPHKKNQNPYNTAKTLCHAARLHAKIAALRKELGG